MDDENKVPEVDGVGEVSTPSVEEGAPVEVASEVVEPEVVEPEQA